MHLVFVFGIWELSEYLVFGIWVFNFFVWHLYLGLKYTQSIGIWAINWFAIWNLWRASVHTPGMPHISVFRFL